MKSTKLFLVLAFAVATLTSWAQCSEYKWPADQSKAEKQVDAIKAAMKDQNYKGATGGINWMLKNVPQWHSDLYVYAIETYDKLAGQELDPSMKQNYVDSLMIVYDLRVSGCGDEMNVINRKAISAYKYNAQNKAKTAEVLAIFDKTYEISGNNVLDNNLDSYMGTIKANVDLLKSLNEDQIMQRYNKLMDVIDAKVKKAQEQNKTNDLEKYKKVTGAIDAKLAKVVKMNCAFVKKNFEPKFKANPNDAMLAKKIYSAMLADKCANDPTWIQAAELLHSTAPDFAVTKELGSVYIQNKAFDKAAPLITELQGKATSPAEKAWVDILNGDVEFQKGNKAGARDLYKKALVTDATNKDAFEHMGDLYVSSASECSKTPGSAEEKLVYIAAFQMYLKSGNREKMESALGQYPTAADLQKAGWKTGDSKKLACWIDESVVVKARKE
jgi:predicted negative regulator of RcsB-dependent stress response